MSRTFKLQIIGVFPNFNNLLAAIISVSNGINKQFTKLYRLARSLKHLINLISDFETAGIGFTSIQDQIDTTTPQGRLIFNIFAGLSEFEREIIRERTMAGLQAARDRGRIGGRKKGLSKDAKIKAAAVKHLYVDEMKSINEICKAVGISRGTIYNYLDYLKVDRVIRKSRSTDDVNVI